MQPAVLQHSRSKEQMQPMISCNKRSVARSVTKQLYKMQEVELDDNAEGHLLLGDKQQVSCTSVALGRVSRVAVLPLVRTEHQSPRFGVGPGPALLPPAPGGGCCCKLEPGALPVFSDNHSNSLMGF
eukprot:TRINITY_DN34226_c0_g1_i1.p1 TRINITY_DN34226_c0_g1~~TRINITY_DN34226_c0_g1_i1.p1  ORF type:complete len:139 (-),score=17.13 TRINITY_DN34226_c0_g1_i1:242-622(-)